MVVLVWAATPLSPYEEACPAATRRLAKPSRGEAVRPRGNREGATGSGGKSPRWASPLHGCRHPDHAALQGSGKEELSPTPPPLRTGQAPCNASGSSLLQRLSRDAVGFCPRFLAMSLPVAVGVEQLQVVQAIVATLR